MNRSNRLHILFYELGRTDLSIIILNQAKNVCSEINDEKQNFTNKSQLID